LRNPASELLLPNPSSPAADAPPGHVRHVPVELNPDTDAHTRSMRPMLWVGAALVMIVWAVEWHAGLINPWDRWLLPLLAGAFATLAIWLTVRAQHTQWAHLGGVLALNLYIVASIHLLLATGGDSPNQYQFLTTLYWLPLAYGIAFVFLPVRWAVGVALTSFGLAFAPIGVLAALGGAPTRWPETFATLVKVLAAAQVAYIALLRTVATMRADYLRTRERMRVVEALAGTDMLTGLPNRRAVTERLESALAAARRSGQPVVVALLDIDHFKRINDMHGHAAGDRVLVALARIFTSQMRGSDFVGRWGGEEFLLVAPATPMHAGIEIAERLRGVIAAWEFDHGQPVTLSIGLSQFLQGDDSHALLQRADKALYRAKAAGRNRIESAAVACAS
jgi:diguanylate cyclase (GGDEF)-like protein